MQTKHRHKKQGMHSIICILVARQEQNGDQKKMSTEHKRINDSIRQLGNDLKWGRINRRRYDREYLRLSGEFRAYLAR